MTLQILMGKLTERVRSILSWAILILAVQALISDYNWVVAMVKGEEIGSYSHSFGRSFVWILFIFMGILAFRWLYMKLKGIGLEDELEEEMEKSDELPGFLDVSGVSVPQGPLTDAEKTQIRREAMGKKLHNGYEFWAVAVRNGKNTEEGQKDVNWKTYCLSERQKYKPLRSSHTG